MVAIEPGTAQLLPSTQWNMTNMLHCNRGCLIIFFAGWSSLAARRAHNPKVVGSNPTPATTDSTHKARLAGLYALTVRRAVGHDAAHERAPSEKSPHDVYRAGFLNSCLTLALTGANTAIVLMGQIGEPCSRAPHWGVRITPADSSRLAFRSPRTLRTLALPLLSRLLRPGSPCWRFVLPGSTFLGAWSKLIRPTTRR